MPRLPSSGDVPTVSPRVARDPGLNAPAGAFTSPLGQAAEVGGAVLGEWSEVAKRQENRRDAIDGADAINRYNTEAESELRRLNTESDLSREDTLVQYGSYLSSKRQEILGGYGGAPENRARLEMRMHDVAGQATSRAAALSADLGRKKVGQTFDRLLVPITSRVTAAPTQESVDGALLQLEIQLEDLAGALDPDEEAHYFRAGAEQIALSAVNALVGRGRIETAAAMLEDGGLAQHLSFNARRDMSRRLDEIRSSRDQITKKFSEFRTVMGRDPGENERLQILGFDVPDPPKPTKGSQVRELESLLGRPAEEEEILRLFGAEAPVQKSTERDKEISDLVGRGVDPATATDIASGNVRVVGPDQFGNFHAANVVTGTMQSLSPADQDAIKADLDAKAQVQAGRQGGQPAPASAPGAPGAPQGESALVEAVGRGVGPIAQLQAAWSNIAGPWWLGQALNQKTTDAQQKLRIFSQIAKVALVNNPRFPVAEQQIVMRSLPDADAWFADPDRVKSDVQVLERSLQTMQDAKKQEIESATITTDRRGALVDQISSIGEVLSLMREGAAEGALAPAAEAEKPPEGIPEGSRQIGQSRRGNPVWETPDGKKLEVIR